MRLTYHIFISAKSQIIKYLRQGIQITGYGNEAFDRLKTSIATAHVMFKRTVGAMLNDEMGISDADGHFAIDASNRYFTPKSANNTGEECKITPEMDPKGFLKQAAGSEYIHTEENKVYYFETAHDTEGGLK